MQCSCSSGFFLELQIALVVTGSTASFLSCNLFGCPGGATGNLVGGIAISIRCDMIGCPVGATGRTLFIL